MTSTAGEPHGRVAVVGLGRVGLPTALLFEAAGWATLGVDADPDVVGALRAARSPVPGVADASVLAALDRSLAVTGEYGRLRDCGAIVVCVPARSAVGGTDALARAAKSIAAELESGQLVVVASTVAPGTTAGEVREALERSGLVAGADFALGYSPERFNAGSTLGADRSTVRLVAGWSDRCRQRAAEVIGTMWKVEEVPSIPVAVHGVRADRAPVALRTAMQRALDDPAGAAREAATRRVHVQAGFRVAEMADRVEAVYRAALAVRRG